MRLRQLLASSVLFLAVAGCLDFDGAIGACRDAGRCGLADGGHLIPNVMLLVETSARSEKPLNPEHPLCPVGCGVYNNPCPVSCPTRRSEVQAGVGAWLAAKGKTLRVGIARYPGGEQCEAPLVTPLPPSAPNDVGNSPLLEAQSRRVRDMLGLWPGMGGAPTTAALHLVANLGSLNDDDQREDFIVLITHGEPNCFEGNPRSMCTCSEALCGTSCSGVCQAQVESCRCGVGDCTGSQWCARGCADSLDDLRSEVRRAPGKIIVLTMRLEGQTADDFQYYLRPEREGHQVVDVRNPGELEKVLLSLF